MQQNANNEGVEPTKSECFLAQAQAKAPPADQAARKRGNDSGGGVRRTCRQQWRLRSCLHSTQAKAAPADEAAQKRGNDSGGGVKRTCRQQWRLRSCLRLTQASVAPVDEAAQQREDDEEEAARTQAQLAFAAIAVSGARLHSSAAVAARLQTVRVFPPVFCCKCKAH